MTSPSICARGGDGANRTQLDRFAEDALGRDYYVRGAAPGAGYRNGYRRGRLKSAEGSIEDSAPQIADHDEPFRSRVRALLGKRTAELEAMAAEMYARDLSTRDIEALFADETGQSLLSRTSVSEITERLWAEYEAFARRDLAEFEIIYLFVDGIAERLHLGQPREAVLAAWAILADGRKALLHLAPGTKEDTASCREFFQDLRRRGLPDPLLVVSDWAPGVIRAIEECFPRSARQRCLAHKLSNLQSKVPEDVWPEFKARTVACYQAASLALARLLRDDIVATYAKDFPSAVACLDDDFEACIAHLKFPLAHRRGDPHHEPAPAFVRRGTAAHQGDPARLRRARRAETEVCRPHPRSRAMARHPDDRVRATAAQSNPRRARLQSCRTNRASRPL